MLPSLRHRFVIAVALLVGGLCWLPAAWALRPAVGVGGLSLVEGRMGVLGAVPWTVLTGLPAILLSLAAAGAGNPLAGVFALSAALAGVAIFRGPGEGWLSLSDVPAAYLRFVPELLLWQAGLVGFVRLAERVRLPLQRRLGPRLLEPEHLGHQISMGRPDSSALAAGGVCALVGGVVSLFLLRNDDNGQVIGGLLIGFTLGGMAGRLICPSANPLPALVSPALVALLSYLYAYFAFDSRADLLATWFLDQTQVLPVWQRLPGLALAMPIHYASAAVAGVTLGTGLGQVFEQARVHTAKG